MGRSGVYVLQVRTKARNVKTTNRSRREAGMPLQNKSLHRACTGSRLEPGSTQPLGVYAPQKRKKTKMRHKEQTSAQASSESGNGKKSNERKNEISTQVRLPFF